MSLCDRKTVTWEWLKTINFMYLPEWQSNMVIRILYQITACGSYNTTMCRCIWCRGKMCTYPWYTANESHFNSRWSRWWDKMKVRCENCCIDNCMLTGTFIWIINENINTSKDFLLQLKLQWKILEMSLQ